MDYDEYDSMDEEFEEQGDSQFIFEPDYVVIGIDTHSSMFRPDDKGTIPMRICFEALVEYSEKFLLETSGCNFFAILLSGQDEPLIKFKDNLIDTIKLLKSKLSLSDDEMKKELERQGDLDMADFLLRGKKLFQGTGGRYKKNFLYITNDFAPNVDKFSVFNEVKLFTEQNIFLQIIPTRKDFDYQKFYNELFFTMNVELPDVEICIDVKGMVQKLSEFLTKREFRNKVRLFPFFNDWEYFIECMSTSVAKSTTFYNKKFTTRGERIDVVRKHTQPTYSLRLKHQTDLENVILDQYEVKELLDSRLPIGYCLMYISKRSAEVGAGIKRPNVILQNPKLTTDYFKSFWTYCVQNDVVLVCIEKKKNPGDIYFAELCPIKVNQQLAFLCIRLPYINDSTPLPSELGDDVTFVEEPSKMKDMKRLVEELTVDFDFSMIPNDRLRKKKAYVKAKLLQEETEEFKSCKFKQEKDLSHLLTNFPDLTVGKPLPKKRSYARGGASKRGKM